MNPSSKKCLLAVLVAACFVSGCTHLASAIKGAPSVFIVLRTPGGKPTPQQVAKVREVVAGAMTKPGVRFVDSRLHAEYVMTAILTPDPADPTQLRVRFSQLLPAGSARKDNWGETPNQFAQDFAKMDQLARWTDSQFPRE